MVDSTIKSSEYSRQPIALLVSLGILLRLDIRNPPVLLNRVPEQITEDENIDTNVLLK